MEPGGWATEARTLACKGSRDESWKGMGRGQSYNRKGLMCFKLGSDIIESEI